MATGVSKHKLQKQMNMSTDSDLVLFRLLDGAYNCFKIDFDFCYQPPIYKAPLSKTFIVKLITQFNILSVSKIFYRSFIIEILVFLSSLYSSLFKLEHTSMHFT